MANKPEAVIAEIAAHSGKLDKRAIIAREAKAKNTELFDGLRYAFDAMITFGVAKIPAHTGTSTKTLPWAKFQAAADKLATREVTGHAARDLVLDLMNASNATQWDGWYRRILLKDMKAKFSENSVNTVVYGDWIKKKWVAGIAPQYRIPEFVCQLATAIDEHPEKLVGRLRIESKLDGARVLTIVYPNGTVKQYSRNGKELLNFRHTADQLSTIAKHLKEPMVFDSEIMSGAFQDLMKQMHRTSTAPLKDAILNMFDMLPLSEFKAGMSKLGQEKRSAELEALYNKYMTKLPNIAILDYEVVDFDTTEGRDRFEEINRSALDAGFEGVMLKNLAAEYETWRGFNWMKRKPVVTVDLKIVGFDMGKAEKKFADTLGALVCEGYEGKKHICVNVSNVGSEAQRNKFWKNRKQLLGQIVEIECDAISKSENSSTYSLRFPRFKRFRDDK